MKTPQQYGKQAAKGFIRRSIGLYIRQAIAAVIIGGISMGWAALNDVYNVDSLVSAAKRTAFRYSACLIKPLDCSPSFVFSGRPGTNLEVFINNAIKEGRTVEELGINIADLPEPNAPISLPTEAPTSWLAEWFNALPEPPSLPGEDDAPGTTVIPENDPPQQVATVGDQVVPKGETLTLPRQGDLKARIQALPTGPLDAAHYDRSEWIERWLKRQGYACNMRIEELMLAAEQIDRNGCTIRSGTWHDPYTDETFTFQKDGVKKYHVDHVVAVGYAAKHGGQHWGKARKEDFSHDPENLWSVLGSENILKSDHGPSTYTPRNRKVHCAFAATWTTITAKYQLYLEEQDKQKLLELANTCPP